MNQVLYKFRRCSEYVFSDLFRDEVSFVALNMFNDAMEGYIPYNREKIYDTLKAKESSRFYQMLIKAEEENIKFGKGHITQFFQKPYSEKLEIVSSNNFKNRALQIIDNFVIKLFAEIRSSFFVACFCGEGQNPVMWSHYADDCSGFVEVYSLQSLKNGFQKLIADDYDITDKNLLKLFTLHEVTYGKKFDCTDFVIKFILHRYSRNKHCYNKFLKYLEETGDYQSLIYILTNKGKEWSYESEYRLILPKIVPSRKRITKDEARNFVKDYCSECIYSLPIHIVAGDKIHKNNLAALAYYCEKININSKLHILKRDFSLIENNTMKVSDFSKFALTKK